MQINFKIIWPSNEINHLSAHSDCFYFVQLQSVKITRLLSSFSIIIPHIYISSSSSKIHVCIALVHEQTHNLTVMLHIIPDSDSYTGGSCVFGEFYDSLISQTSRKEHLEFGR